MANSYVITTATANQNTIAVPFDYIDRLHVHVEVNGVPLTAFIWNTSSILGLVTPLTGGQRIYLYRATPGEQPVVTYAPGAITSANLNDQTEQLLYLLQEAQDTANASIGLDFGTGQFAAQGLRLENLAAPLLATDAVTKAYADVILLQGNELIVAGLAAVGVQVTAASGHATAAAASASAANVDRVAVAAHVVTVNQAVIDASASSLLASKYADNPENSAVVAGRFSSMHWSKKAEAFANSTAMSSEAVGAISMAMGAVDPGHLRMGEGGTYDRAVYPQLATYMDANGATAFGLTAPQIASGTLPDWRDYSPRTAGGALGPAVGAKQGDAVQDHAHLQSTTFNTGTTYGNFDSGITNNRSGFGATTTPTQGVSSPALTATETRVKSFGVRWQIKAFGAVVNQGTADLVAIANGYNTLLNGAVRKDIDQNAQAETSAFKVNILKNTLQAWEQVGPIINLAGLSQHIWTGLGDFLNLRLKMSATPAGTGLPALRTSVDNGATWLSLASDYQYSVAYKPGTAAWTSSGSAGQSHFYGGITSWSSTYGGQFDFNITRFNKALISFYRTDIQELDGASGLNFGTYAGYVNQAVAQNALRLWMNTSVLFTSGHAVLEGVRG